MITHFVSFAGKLCVLKFPIPENQIYEIKHPQRQHQFVGGRREWRLMRLMLCPVLTVFKLRSMNSRAFSPGFPDIFLLKESGREWKREIQRKNMVEIMQSKAEKERTGGTEQRKNKRCTKSKQWVALVTGISRSRSWFVLLFTAAVCLFSVLKNKMCFFILGGFLKFKTP